MSAYRASFTRGNTCSHLSLRGSLVKALLALAVALEGCMAPAPPIVVNTPFGKVRAESQASADGVASMLIELAPRVRELLPDSQERSIDVWVQKQLQVYRYQTRPDSVRGFTLLSDEFKARRIHLQNDEQSPWYLSHELVHALIGKSWKTLPGILEEGLADVIAERLNPMESGHIRAHRLLNASAFSSGIKLELLYHKSLPGTPPESTILVRAAILQLSDPVPLEMAVRLLGTQRADLRSGWDALPESFYGFAWLLVSRIGVEPLYALCLRAESAGLALVPKEWLFEAAELRLEDFTPTFLASCFTPSEFKHAMFLQPKAFAAAAIEILLPIHSELSPERYFPYSKPAFKLADGTEIPLVSTGPMMEELILNWPRD